MQEQYTGAEKRAALEICVIRDSLETMGGNARWISHDRNPADCLTKLKGNVEPLLKLLREGTYQLVAEQDEMEQRKMYREMTGKKNPRPNQSVDNNNDHGNIYNNDNHNNSGLDATSNNNETFTTIAFDNNNTLSLIHI